MNYLTANNISYQVDDNTTLWRDINVSLGNHKIGLIGDNGVGKTTLLRVLVGELSPTTGTVHRIGNISYLPQQLALKPQQKISELFDLGYDRLNIRPEQKKIIAALNLNKLDFELPLNKASGGEKTKLLLGRAFWCKPDVIVLDEPTNNLDEAARHHLYDLIFNWSRGILIVSHDRSLLRLMDEIWELTATGLKKYSGHYDDYLVQKNSDQAAAARQFQTAKKTLRQTKNQAQLAQEKQQRKARRGHRNIHRLGVSQAVIDKMRDTSESTTSRIRLQHVNKIKRVAELMQQAKDKILPENVINLDLPLTKVPTGKMVLEIKDLGFAYGRQSIINNLNLSVFGPARLAVHGDNGSGKTTLAKLIMGQLKPQTGQLTVGVKRISYLDQDIALLDPAATLLNNLMRISELGAAESRHILARYLFRSDTPEKKVNMLSGGEKIRAALACIFSGPQPPQLLILDEPTNNLDMHSIEKFESALSNYYGAMLVISHDQDFLNNIGVDRDLYLRVTKN
jgi:ATPase subunit of ABC transporter with duplicated ATPase domains